MRVIAGEFRSRQLKSLPGTRVRPTPDRMRETLFNILGSEVAGALFVDAYAGTGTVGIEALSRGAGRVVFLEKSKEALQVLVGNVKSLDVGSRAQIVLGSALAALSGTKASIVFLDPPYDLDAEYASAMATLGRGAVALVIAQHDRRLILQESYGTLKRVREVRQGDNVLSFFRRDLPPGNPEEALPTPA